MEETIISSDSHVIEVPDLWEKGMPSSFKERAPKAFFDEKRDAWMFGSAKCRSRRSAGYSWPVSDLSSWKVFAGRVSPWRAPADGIPSNE